MRRANVIGSLRRTLRLLRICASPWVKNYKRPSDGKAIGITEPVGWHTLRHSFGTLMKANGEDVKTIQELLRHANFKVTMDVYTQAVTKVKRTAHSRVARQIMGPIQGKKKEENGDE